MDNRDIINIQNEEHFINLLKAQQVTYSQTKRLHFIDVVSIIIAVSLPLIAYFYKQVIITISAIGVIWTIVYLLSDIFRKRKTIEGAKIQEQFDTGDDEIPA